VVTQLAAVCAALDRAGFSIISTAMKDCLSDSDRGGRSDENLTTEELEKLFLMLA
jgi:DNA-binding FrmR family transcriptional regulator